MAQPAEIVLSLADAKRLVQLLDAYGYVAGKAAKWGYAVDAPRSCWTVADRLTAAIDAAEAAS